MLEIIEKFITIAGEAPIIGKPIFLIRLSWCNLDCNFCDTPYKDEVNIKLTVQELNNEINKVINEYSGISVLFTGGEPLYKDRGHDIINIAKNNSQVGFYVETNGSIEIKSFDIDNLHYVIDWKSPSSGCDNSFFDLNLGRLRENKDCIKFVIEKSDFTWVIDKIKLIKEINPGIDIYLSGQSKKITLEEIADFIIKKKLGVNLSLQLHKIIWPGKDRGV